MAKKDEVLTFNLIEKRPIAGDELYISVTRVGNDPSENSILQHLGSYRLDKGFSNNSSLADHIVPVIQQSALENWGGRSGAPVISLTSNLRDAGSGVSFNVRPLSGPQVYNFGNSISGIIFRNYKEDETK